MYSWIWSYLCCILSDWRLWHVLVLLPLVIAIQGDNDLIGTIPTEIGVLSQLSFLDLGRSSSMHQWVVLSLYSLCLTSLACPTILPLVIAIEGDNELIGTIATEIGELSQLSFLDLGRWSSIHQSVLLSLYTLADVFGMPYYFADYHCNPREQWPKWNDSNGDCNAFPNVVAWSM